MRKKLKKINKEIYRLYIETGLFRKSKYLRLMLNYSEYQHRKRQALKIPSDVHYDLTSLEKDGYTFIKTDEALTEELIAWCRQKNQATENLEVSSGKKFFAHLLNPEDYRQESILLRFALNEKLLNTVAKYIGNAPFLGSVEVIRSQHYQDQPVQSQLWHSDSMDTRMIKVFVYIDPVESENGPFTLLPASECRKLHYSIFHKKGYLTDKELGQFLDLSKKIEIVGPAGTAALIDTTNCYHYGSRCEKPRLVFTAYYMSGFGFHKRHYPRYCFKWPELPDLDLRKLSPIQRMALGFME